MQLPGLISVSADQTETLDKLADLMATCFLEEPWYKTYLQALDTNPDYEVRKLEILRACIRADYQVTAPYGCCYMLPHSDGVANAYLRSELQQTSWGALENQVDQLIDPFLLPSEKQVLNKRGAAMESMTDTCWPLAYEQDADFIYFISLSINPQKRGSGAFRRMIEPFLHYADTHNIDCCLDCYSQDLEQIYGHFGFEVVERKMAPGFDIHERCMVRKPHTGLPR